MASYDDDGGRWQQGDPGPIPGPWPKRNGRGNGESGPLTAGRVTRADLAAIPPREWLYGHKLIRGFVSVLASPGGVGKSAWIMATACDMAAGKNTLYDEPHHPLTVWIYNLEDPLSESLRRLEAVMQYKRLDDAILERVRLNSGRDRPLIVAAEMPNRITAAMPDGEKLADACQVAEVDVLVVDPVVRSHAASENDNGAMDVVMNVYSRVAADANIAVLLAHHSRKGFTQAGGGDADTIRGASSVVSAARVAMTLQPMSREEAAELGVLEAERRLLIRLDNAKSNLAPPSDAAEWLHLASVGIGNDTPSYPAGDFVQVLEPWTTPNAFDGLTPAKANAILDQIARGYTTDTGAVEQFTNAPQSDRWAGRVIMAAFMGSKTSAQAKKILKTWLETGILEEREYMSPGQRKLRKGLFVKSRPGPDHTAPPPHADDLGDFA